MLHKDAQHLPSPRSPQISQADHGVPTFLPLLGFVFFGFVLVGFAGAAESVVFAFFVGFALGVFTTGVFGVGVFFGLGLLTGFGRFTLVVLVGVAAAGVVGFVFFGRRSPRRSRPSSSSSSSSRASSSSSSYSRASSESSSKSRASSSSS